jgi:uncharacterized damage-inducible protein DinB
MESAGRPALEPATGERGPMAGPRREEDMSEMERLWDLMQRSFEGGAWHGPALRPLLQDVTAEQAAARPIAGARTIWETTLHLTAQEDAARRRLQGEALGTLPPQESWPAVSDTSREAWRRARDRFEDVHRSLRHAVAALPDECLCATVPGRDYPMYLMLHGLVQHAQYHAGQIALLQQAQGLTPAG